MKTGGERGPGQVRSPRGWRRGLFWFLAGLLAGWATLWAVSWLGFLTSDYSKVQREDLHPQVVEALHVYLTEEGPDARGERFRQFALLLDAEVGAGRELSERQLMNYFGPPDLTTEKADMRYFEFNFDYHSAQDWAVLVAIKNGIVQWFGYNPAHPGAGDAARVGATGPKVEGGFVPRDAAPRTVDVPSSDVATPSLTTEFAVPDGGPEGAAP